MRGRRGDGRAALIALVAEQRPAPAGSDGDPERLAALLQALVHGAVALALAGHLSPGGKGYAGPATLSMTSSATPT